MIAVFNNSTSGMITAPLQVSISFPRIRKQLHAARIDFCGSPCKRNPTIADIGLVFLLDTKGKRTLGTT